MAELPLNQDRVHAAIDQACAYSEENYMWTGKTCNIAKDLTLRRATKDHLPSILQLLKTEKAADPRYDEPTTNATSSWNTQACRLDVPSFFALVLLRKSQQSICLGLATVYFAYSTWDGRVLYLDKILLPAMQGERDWVFCRDDRDALQWTFQYTLVDITLRTGCSRYTWQHGLPSPIYPSGELVQPEALDGWLTLHRPYECDALDYSSEWTLESDRAAICSCLDQFAQFQATTNNNNDKDPLKVRLATIDDVATIERLVKGLAEYEKEPDSVHVNHENYSRDGFGKDQPPLFHCFLLESVLHDNSSGDGRYICGMAFCYFGYAFGEGRFLYLEDLYLEKKYRGKGGGSLVMQILATVARSTSCIRMVWQALDWNTPALEFYDKKIGAKVQQGMLSKRFAGDDLARFHKSRIDGKH